MTPLLGWLTGAGFDAQEVIRSWNTFVSGTSEGVLIFGALLLVTLATFIWAAFFRKQRRRRHSHHRPSPQPPVPETEAGGSGGLFFRSRRKRRHRHDAPRNPTLAETGGLPPLRADDPEPPLHSP